MPDDADYFPSILGNVSLPKVSR